MIATEEKEATDRIEVELWGNHEEGRSYTAAFQGTWLVLPDRDDTRTREEGFDAGAYWGIALTAKKAIAVYTAHCNDRFAPSLDTYDSLNEAKEEGVPSDILAQAAKELGDPSFVVELDI